MSASASASARATLTVLLLAALSGAVGALQCGQVTQLMAPCMPYLSGAPGMTPYGLCCNSLGVLNQLAATTADRVAACNCVKAAAGGFPAVDFTRAAGLPAACGISVSFAISPNLDCNQYLRYVRIILFFSYVSIVFDVVPLTCACRVTQEP